MIADFNFVSFLCVCVETSDWALRCEFVQRSGQSVNYAFTVALESGPAAPAAFTSMHIDLTGLVCG